MNSAGLLFFAIAWALAVLPLAYLYSGFRWKWLRANRLGSVAVAGTIFCYVLSGLLLPPPKSEIQASDITDPQALASTLAAGIDGPKDSLSEMLWSRTNAEDREAIAALAGGNNDSDYIDQLAAFLDRQQADRTLVSTALKHLDLPGPLATRLRAALTASVDQENLDKWPALRRGTRLLLDTQLPGLQAETETLFQWLFLSRVVLLLTIVLFLDLVTRRRLWQVGLHSHHLLPTVLLGISQALVWFPPVMALNLLARSAIPQQIPNPGQDFLFTTHDPLSWLAFITSVVVMAPVVEELIFRGVFQGALHRAVRQIFGESTPRWLPAVVAISVVGALFGFAHGVSWPDPLPLTVLGIALGVAYHLTGSLWAPVAMHSTFNALNVALSTWQSGMG